MKQGDVVQVRDLSIIVTPLHGKRGRLISWSYHQDHRGPYTMFRVRLDEPVDVGGGIVMHDLFMPSTCFDFNLFREEVES